MPSFIERQLVASCLLWSLLTLCCVSSRRTVTQLREENLGATRTQRAVSLVESFRSQGQNARGSDIKTLLSWCQSADDCQIKVKSEKYKCVLRITPAENCTCVHESCETCQYTAFLEKCHSRKKPKLAAAADGLGESTCCESWDTRGEIIEINQTLGSPCVHSCIVEPGHIRVQANAWKKLSLEISFAVAGDDPSSAVAIFRTAKINHLNLNKVRKNYPILDPKTDHYDWLLARFKAFPEALFEAVAFAVSPRLAAHHDAWYWAADTSAQVESNVKDEDAQDMLKARFVSVFDRLPMNYLLGMCTSPRGCTLQVKSDHVKCKMKLNAAALGAACYAQVYECQKRVTWTRSVAAVKNIGRDDMEKRDAYPGEKRVDMEKRVEMEKKQLGALARRDVAFAKECSSPQGCCIAYDDFEFAAEGPTGLRLLVQQKGSGFNIDFDHAFLISSNDNWVCGESVPESKCYMAKSLAHLFRKDTGRTKALPGRAPPGAVVLRAVLGTKFAELNDGSLDMDLCVDNGLRQATRLRNALLVKAFSGLVAAVLALPLGAFAPLTIAVKLLLRIAAGGHYAEASCVFEVSSLFPGYRDQLLTTDTSSPMGGKRFWGYGPEKEMKKCMDVKNKLFRLRNSATKASTGGAVTGALWITAAGAGTVTQVVRDATEISKGASDVLPVVSVAGTSVPLLGMILGVAEAVAGMHQAHTLYNWARFRTYRDCSASIRADMYQSTLSFLDEYGATRERFQELQQNLMPRFESLRRTFTCLLALVKKQGDQRRIEMVLNSHNDLAGTVLTVSESAQKLDENFKVLSQLAVKQVEAAKWLKRKALQEWNEKERTEFGAELILNPAYFLLETLFPNGKYADAQQELGSVMKDVDLENHGTVERLETPASTTFHNESTVGDFCPGQAAWGDETNAKVDDLAHNGLIVVRQIEQDMYEQLRTLRAATPLVDKFTREYIEAMARSKFLERYNAYTQGPPGERKLLEKYEEDTRPQV